MRKRMWLYALIILGCLFQPLEAMALTSVDVSRSCSLKLHYTQAGIGFEDLEVRIYRVAEAFEDGTFDLISPFSGYPVNIHGISSQTEWKDVAATLSAYIAVDQVQPSRTEKTDDVGTVTFSGLETGLYLVSSTVAEHESGTYFFNDFMVYLPTPQAGGDFCYDLEANPKCSRYDPKTEYKVVKLWKDAGEVEKRPLSVTVDILKDGIVQQTQILSAENDWTYTWQVPDGEGIWTVVERDVPEDYTVAISFHETTFMITNTHTLPVDPPQTGDTSAPWLYMLITCISGFVLLIVGMSGKRGRNHEQTT